MTRKFIVSLEELEIEKYLEKEHQEEISSDYDNLYNSIIDKKEEDDDENMDDSELDDEAKDTASIAMESFSKLQMTPALEEISYDSAADAIKEFGLLGLHYTPIILSKVYKGVIYSLSKLVVLLSSSIKNIHDYQNRLSNNFNDKRKDIAAMIKAIDELEDVSDLTDLKFTQTKIINNLKIKDSIDISANIDVLKKFLTTIIDDFDKVFSKDIAASSRLMDYAKSSYAKEPLVIMNDVPLRNILVKKSFQGYEEASELIDSYGYKDTLPGDIALIAYLPKDSLNTIEDIINAYNTSSVFLGFMVNNFVEIQEIDYMAKEDLKSLLKQLDNLCELAITHVDFYESVINRKKSWGLSLRNYISFIVKSTKINVKSSLVDYVTLKSVFADKVYIAGAINVHDYTIKIINSAMLYCKKNIKELAD